MDGIWGRNPMNLTKKRWIILGASCLINLCIGSLYAWSVFATPMAKYLTSITRSEITSLSIIFTIANSVGPVTMITGGFINDKLGPKWVILVGGVLFGLGMLLSGFATSMRMLMVTYGLGVGLGVGMVYGCTVSNSVKWFPDKRGFAGGIATASYGMSSIAIPPLASLLISNMDVTAAFKLLGGVMLVIICFSAFFIKTCPKDYVPDGYVPPMSTQAARVGKNWKEMLKDPIFYVMIIMMCCGAFTGLMIISQASPLAQRMIGMTAMEAATAVSVLALFNTIGRITAGFASDKLGTVTTIKIVFVISAISLMTLYFSGVGMPVLFYVGLCGVGLAFGSIMGIYPGFTAAQFGGKNNSVNYGIIFIGFAMAGYFGPSIMTKLYTATGRDQTSFAVATALSLFGFILAFVYNKVRIKEEIL